MKKHQIKVPALAADMSGAVLVSWEKSENEAFSKGDVLYAVETNKVVSQVEAEFDGTMGKTFVAEGDPVQSGEVIAEASEN